MLFGRRLIPAILVLFALLPNGLARGGGVPVDLKNRVLDLLFSQGAIPTPFLSKLTLRYGDTDAQLVVVVRPGEKYWQRRYDVFRYSLAGMKEGDLSRLVSKMEAANPRASLPQIAAKLRVKVAQSSIDPNSLKKALASLGEVRVSPRLASQICVDECPQYEFWYDTGQDYIHLVLTDPPQKTPEGQLVQWMIEFRKDLPAMLTRPWTSTQ